MNVKDIAKLYWDAGLWVTPIIVGGKKPTLKGWNKARPSWETLDKQLKVGMNLALVTGKQSGIVCLDIDEKAGGKKWLVENEDKLGNYVTERTPNGGYHLYFKYPAELNEVPTKRSPYSLAPGVELMGDGHGKVTTWPSVLEAGIYYFENDLTLLDVAFEADELPLWLLGLAPKKERNIDLRSISQADDSPQTIEKVRELLANYPVAIEGKGGDATTYGACCVCYDHGLSLKTAWLLIQEYNQTHCKPKWKTDDLKAKVINAYSYAKSGFGSESPAAQFEPEEQVEVKETKATAREEGPGYSKKRSMRNALLFIEQMNGRLMFCKEQGLCYNEEKKHWEFIDEITLKSLILSDISQVSPQLFDAVKVNMINEIAKLVEMRLQSTMPEIVTDKWLTGLEGDFVSMQNGIVNIKTGEVLPHSKDWFSFTTLGFNYEPDATAPQFTSFLKSVWSDQETIDALQLWVGYMLLRDMTQQKFALLIGESRSGKGTLATVIEQLLGADNCASCTLTQLASDFGLSPLIGKKAVFFHDAQKAQGMMGDLATERLISIVGNDPQAINRKNREILTMRLPLKISMVCNQMPAFINSRGALTNRMIVFPFTESFKGREDLELSEKLKTELPGIFNWAMKGAQAVQAGKRLFQSKQGEASLVEITQLLEPLAAFVASEIRCALDDIDWGSGTQWLEAKESFTPTEDIYRAYTVWCSNNGHSPKSATKFSSEIKPWLPKDAEPSQRKTHNGFKRGYLHIALVRPTPEFN